MKIGLIGEAPNDVNAIKNILSKRYNDVTFEFMLERINGSQLDSQKTKHFLSKEYQSKQPDFVIFIRDLDALYSDKTQLAKRKKYFSDFKTVVGSKAIYLLHIFEIEALILCDLETFNKIYNSEITYNGDPMNQIGPKEILKVGTKYNETHNANIFDELDFEKLLECSYFKKFITDFEKYLN